MGDFRPSCQVLVCRSVIEAPEGGGFNFSNVLTWFAVPEGQVRRELLTFAFIFGGLEKKLYDFWISFTTKEPNHQDHPPSPEGLLTIDPPDPGRGWIHYLPLGVAMRAPNELIVRVHHQQQLFGETRFPIVLAK